MFIQYNTTDTWGLISREWQPDPWSCRRSFWRFPWRQRCDFHWWWGWSCRLGIPCSGWCHACCSRRTIQVAPQSRTPIPSPTSSVCDPPQSSWKGRVRHSPRSARVSGCLLSGCRSHTFQNNACHWWWLIGRSWARYRLCSWFLRSTCRWRPCRGFAPNRIAGSRYSTCCRAPGCTHRPSFRWLRWSSGPSCCLAQPRQRCISRCKNVRIRGSWARLSKACNWWPKHKYANQISWSRPKVVCQYTDKLHMLPSLAETGKATCWCWPTSKSVWAYSPRRCRNPTLCWLASWSTLCWGSSWTPLQI